MEGEKEAHSTLTGLPLRWHINVYPTREQPFTVKYRRETQLFTASEAEARSFVVKFADEYRSTRR